MAEATTVVEGKVKYREGKKWKSRWCVVKKPSPVADRLQLVFYKDVQEALRAGGKVKTAFPLDGYCGLETGFQVDREENVLAVLCLRQVTLLAFETRECLIQFEVKIRRSLGQDYQYPVRLVKAPLGSRLPLNEGVKLLIHGTQLCVTGHIPPRILQCWNINDLRRYGAVEGKFCFDGGSRCGRGAGVHAMQTDQADEISEILRVNSLGKPSTASRAGGYRSSQLLEDSVATGDCLPSAGTKAGTPGSESGASVVGEEASPMLMCCQSLPAGDKQGCCKRHSVSITEFHRNSAIMFPEKFRLMPMEKQEHQHQMAVCDAPPKHMCRADNISGYNCSEACSVPEKMGEVMPGASRDWAPARPQCPVIVNGGGRGGQAEPGHSLAEPLSQTRRVNSVVGMPRSLDTTIFDSMISAHVDITKRMEALQTLHKQETHLQQEMDLLDQMLQSCHPGDGGDKHTSAESTEHTQLYRDGICTLEPPIKSSIPVDVSRKSSSLPPKISGKKEPSVCAPPAKKLSAAPVASEHTGQKESRSSARSHVKLLYRPHSSAPLPYINLSKNTAEMDNRFIDMCRGRDSVGNNVLQPPRRFQNGIVGSSANGGNIGVVPARCSSETRILPRQDGLVLRKPLPLPPNHDIDRDDVEGLSISVEKLDDDVLLPPTTYAPPVPYPRQISILTSSAASTQLTVYPSVLVPAIPTPPAREPIYANETPPMLPPRSYRESPPVLPPKGPGLLRRTRMLSSGSGSSINNRVPPPIPLRTRSLSVGSEGKFSDYDNQPGPDCPPPLPLETKRGSAEDTYLPMGSPQNPFRREGGQSRREGQSSRPSSLCITGSPKPCRHKNLSSVGHRGNADVLSGYMDMANMFVPEPKQNVSASWDKPRQTLSDAKETQAAEPTVVWGSAMPPESNYMEMSSLPPPAKRKSAVLKNLEALHTYVTSTNAGETPPRTRSRSHTPVPPTKSITPTPTTSRDKCKVYTRTGSYSSLPGETSETRGMGLNQGDETSCHSLDSQRPAIPFTNLKNFEQKHTKTSYVNTSIPTPEVPLPEPPKKEEGFFSRLIRRNSKEKSTSQSQENLNAQKNRTSVFERTMSVHVQGHAGEERSSSRLKLGRRRSASFPNRLSFHETTDTDLSSKKDRPTPPLPEKSTTPVKTSASTRSSSATKSSARFTSPALQSEQSMAQLTNHSESLSMQDLSDSSDRAPLLQRARSSSRSDMRILTVLHVQQDPITCPITSMHTELTRCLNDGGSFTSSKVDHILSQQSSKHSFSVDCSRADSSTRAVSDSSKTDDEKLIELFENGKQQSVMSDIQEIKSKMCLPLADQVACRKEKSEEMNNQEDIPPLIPPKRRQSLLTPVSEVSSPGALSFSTPSPPTPPQHLASYAVNREESFYVDMKELLPQPPKCPPTFSENHGRLPENPQQVPGGPLQQASSPAQLPEVSPPPSDGPPVPCARHVRNLCSCPSGEKDQSAASKNVRPASEDKKRCSACRAWKDDSVTLTPP